MAQRFGWDSVAFRFGQALPPMKGILSGPPAGVSWSYVLQRRSGQYDIAAADTE